MLNTLHGGLGAHRRGAPLEARQAEGVSERECLGRGACTDGVLLRRLVITTLLTTTQRVPLCAANSGVYHVVAWAGGARQEAPGRG